MSISALLYAPNRHPFLAGEITLLTGEILPFSGDQALSFSLSEGAAAGQLLGGAFSAACSLSLQDENACFTGARSLYGAQVKVKLCLEEEEAPLCTFTVQRIARQEGTAALTLSGSDALGTAFEGALTDDFSYPMTLGQLAVRLAGQAGFSLSDEFPNAGVTIPSRPDWGDISLRQALAYTACAAGCLALISREGKLLFKRLWQPQTALSILPEATLRREYGQIAFGPLACLTIACKGAPRGTPPLVVGAAVPDATNALSVSGNPLFPYNASHARPLAEGLLSALQGLCMTQAKITWRGDPALTLGDRVRIQDSAGQFTDTLVTGQTLTFSRGFSMQTDCAAPSAPSSAGRLFTSSGALNAAMLDGSLNGAIIRDGSIAAKALVAGSVTALQLAAQSVTATQLAAQAVTADKLAARSVAADHLAADAVQAVHLSAGALEAVDAHLQTADIAWASIDTLQSAIADIVRARLDTADIDWAHVKDLLSDTAIITQGTAGELYISRLAVTEANLLSLTVGQLMVRGEDGGFYAVTVNADGQIVTEKKQIANADVEDHAIHGGEKLMEGSVTAETLNAREIFGDSALIRRLIASNLDVDTLFGREAVLQKINTLDITGNASIRLYVQKQDAVNAYLRVTENGLEIGREGDPAKFRADNRTLEVTNLKTERVSITQSMSQDAEWAWIATKSGLGLKYIG